MRIHRSSLVPGILLAALFFIRPEAAAQDAVDLAVSWGVVDNYVGGPDYFESRLELENVGPHVLRDDWTIYFNFIRRIRSDSLRGPISIRLINGSFYRMTPEPGFTLEPGASVALRIIASNWAIRESAAPSGFYVIFGDGEPQPISKVTVEPFTEPRQMNRYQGDMLPVATPESRFRRNEKLRLLDDTLFSPIIPTPVSFRPLRGAYALGRSILISAGREARPEAEHLSESLRELVGVESRIVEPDEQAADVTLSLSDTAAAETGCDVPGSYALRIDDRNGIRVTAREPAGMFYGIQSLLAMIDPRPLPAGKGIRLQNVEISDCPRFPYRGLMIDVARHFHPAERIKQTLRIMSFYKLNRLHFHLSDDEGWRLPVAALPELTTVGGRRGHTLDSHDLLPPSFGSGPDPETSAGSGFYTHDDFVDLLRFATEHHVEVIPEIDTPGHMRAAIKSMEYRYRRLAADAKPEEAQEFLLTDFADRSVYRSVQGWDDNVANVCLESTFRFMETVIDELVGLFEEAGAPLTTIHLGGDEVPHGVWEKSPACDRLLASRDDLNSVQDLSDDFYRRLVTYLGSKGLKGAGWEDITLEARTIDGVRREAPKPDLAGSVIPYAWNSVWGWGGEERGYKLANAGYQVVLANVPNLYFDLAAEKHPKEPGFAWGGFVDERKAFEFTPLDIYNSAYEDRLGRPIPPDRYRDAVRLTTGGTKNILGIQGQLWGENTPSEARFEYHLYPKLLALAERAWAAQPKWEKLADRQERLPLLDEDWNRFANSLGQRELLRLSVWFGLTDFRIPPPGAEIVDGMLYANTGFPGLRIRYTTDGAEPTPESRLWTEPVHVSGRVLLRAFDASGRGGRTVVVRH